jgi:ferredoxin
VVNCAQLSIIGRSAETTDRDSVWWTCCGYGDRLSPADCIGPRCGGCIRTCDFKGALLEIETWELVHARAVRGCHVGLCEGALFTYNYVMENKIRDLCWHYSL